MAIILKTKQEVQNNDKMVKILSIECLPKGQLPTEYICSKNCLFQDSGYCTLVSGRLRLIIGKGSIFYKWFFFNTVLPAIEEAGENLKKINKEIRERKKKEMDNWKGYVVYKI